MLNKHLLLGKRRAGGTGRTTEFKVGAFKVQLLFVQKVLFYFYQLIWEGFVAVGFALHVFTEFVTTLLLLFMFRFLATSQWGILVP